MSSWTNKPNAEVLFDLAGQFRIIRFINRDNGITIVVFDWTRFGNVIYKFT